ncbi:MAG: 30S ribosomal protein S17 [Nitrospira sp.]|nr:30S ribosomal protein S17 [Nitrospira sp.]MCA9465392.1 30S ribosomal protein S17 [Nitrospira sp.]MCA9474617.1 30S ribosomal protein S17 [Nitrospira sp.]MCA9479242.1 30S ribosomal protein S17 [Nitrospira sp.]MCB9709962.1 30S ribosomal protein S17 [Nitrospiraceae bacterium]
MSQVRPVPQEIFGKVVSNKMQKTVVVEIVRVEQHPVYGKVVRKKSKLKAHDETNRCQVGDKVRIGYSRPISKDKNWRVLEVLPR